MATKHAHCYVCETKAALSPRSRCVACEYKAAMFNENENEELREKIEELERALPFRDRVRTYGVAHPHVPLRMTSEGAATRDGTIVVPR